MATKERISEEINDSLDTDIDWSELKKDDLEELKLLLDGGYMMETTAKHYIKENGKKAFEKEVDEWFPGKHISKLL